MLLCKQTPNIEDTLRLSPGHSWAIVCKTSTVCCRLYPGREYSILLSVTPMFNINQICHSVSVGCCVRNM